MEWLKPLHISCVALSFCGFFLRGVWMLRGSAWLHNKWVKRLPHVVDTGLLVSALSMLYVMQWSVLDHPWLQVKIVALLVYIGLGTLALKPGRSLGVRVAAWMIGLLVFLFIVSVALTKSVSGFVVL
jgi:uncharacterized membrane protein SirB2